MTETSASLSQDALRVIKARRPARMPVAGASPVGSGNQQAPVAALAAFIRWFADQRASRGVVMPRESMLDVQPELINQFRVGMSGQRYFVAIPESIRPWFEKMPWLHAVINTDYAKLSFVCRPVTTEDVNVPAFSLNFPFEDRSTLRGLSNYHFIDIRFIRSDGVLLPAIQVSRELVLTLNVRVVKGADFVDLLDGCSLGNADPALSH
jgi:hypothetical protein